MSLFFRHSRRSYNTCVLQENTFGSCWSLGRMNGCHLLTVNHMEMLIRVFFETNLILLSCAKRILYSWQREEKSRRWSQSHSWLHTRWESLIFLTGQWFKSMCFFSSLPLSCFFVETFIEKVASCLCYCPCCALFLWLYKLRWTMTAFIKYNFAEKN